MRQVKVINKTRDSVLGSRVAIADRWWSRMRGFVSRPAPGAGEGILLSPCRAVHMLGVSFPLDVLFVDRRGSVVATYQGLEPGRRTGFHRNAEYALEVPAGTIAATQTAEHDLLAWLPAEMPAKNGVAPVRREPRQSTVNSQQSTVDSQQSKVESRKLKVEAGEGVGGV
ncbi:MAG: DUF192 domain-containing protein [Longimicrobiales bacterium]